MSIGAALSCKEDDFDSLYKKADEALYKSKENGKNQYTLYSCS
ncbi:GGDEF domain-containing protein [Sporosarcina contaminans]|uniref:GGDEF domain-containing protein n=1 Tax=Sporosarcina contaminans TaxID=633403 RepID=A0ABW3TWS3_9BACL